MNDKGHELHRDTGLYIPRAVDSNGDGHDETSHGLVVTVCNGKGSHRMGNGYGDVSYAGKPTFD